MIIQFKEWVPDAAALGNPGAVQIVNAYPGLTGYKPVGSLQPLTDALTARPRGAIQAKDRDGNTFQYAGDVNDLYSLSGTTWGTVSLIRVTGVSIDGGGSGYTAGDDLTVSGGTGTAATLNVDSVSGGVVTGVSVLTEGAYSAAPSNPVSVTGGTGTGATFDLTTTKYATGTEESWGFVRWKNSVLATNFSDFPQTITMGGSGFTNLTTDFKCRHLAVIGDRVVAANTFDSSDGNVSDRVRWSAFNDATDWTVDPATGADFRDLNVGGAIRKVIGGEFGVIVSDSSTFRMIPSGPTIFRIDEVLPGTGTLASGSVTQLADTVYFLSERGFVSIRGATGVSFPGAGKVDQWVLRDIDQDNLHRISSTSDPRGGRVAWAYPGAGSTSGRPNRVIIYDQVLSKWALLEVDLEMVWRAGGVGFTLEQLDTVSSSIDALPASLDSSRWKGGGIPLLSGFDSDFKHGFFDGSPLTAKFEPRETQLINGRKAMLNGFRPLIDGGSVTAKVGKRDNQADAISFGPTLSTTSSGRFASRTNARYHTFQLFASGEWDDAIGIDVDSFRPGSRR